MSPKDCAYIVERLAVRFMSMVADYERKMVEHRDAFGVRTSADAKIIDGMRAEVEDLRSRLNALGIQAAKQAGEALGMVEGEGLLGAARRVVKERDGLLTQVQDMRAEIERLKLACDTYAADWDTAGKACRIRVDEYPLSSVIRLVRDDAERAAVAKRLVKERDALRAEVADLRGIVDMVHASLGIKSGDHIGKAIEALKSWNPKFKVGDKLEWQKLGLSPCSVTVTGIRLVYDCIGEGAEYPVGHSEDELREVASHDTPAGKEAAEAVVRDSQMTEIKVGDVVEVVSASGGQTWMADVGSTGKVRRFELIDSIECVRLQNLPGKRNALGGYVSLCDVRKVPQ